MRTYGKPLHVVLFLLLLLPRTAALSAERPSFGEVIQSLDQALDRRDTFNQSHARYLDSLTAVADNERLDMGERLRAKLQLGDGARTFDILRATLVYESGAKMAEQIGNDTLAMLFHIRHAAYMPLQGYVSKSVREFADMDTSRMSHWMKTQYLDSKRQMARYAADAYKDYPEDSRKFQAMSDHAQQRLLQLLDPDTPAYQLNLGESLARQGHRTQARDVLVRLTHNVPHDTNIYARATSILADICRDNNDDGFMFWLAESALADTRSATLEVSSLQRLGQVLFHMGDVERSHRYLTYALQSAVDCHATLRILQSSEMMPLIEQAHVAETAASNRRVAVAMFVLVLLLVAVLVLLWLVYRKASKLSLMTWTLKRENQVKEYYLAQFLGLCSMTMDKLSSFGRMVQRKIAAGSASDLVKTMNSSKFAEEQTRDFYRIFDEAFLRIYPDFLANVNALLRPESQLDAPASGLSPELRMLALMRLGIDEIPRLAQMLNYSVNTIYAYRNRMKNRAVSRDTFEADIMAIGS